MVDTPVDKDEDVCKIQKIFGADIGINSDTEITLAETPRGKA